MKDSNLNSADTIVALATPRGRGALAIVRLSGDRAIEVASSISGQPQKLYNYDSHHLHIVEVVEAGGGLLDRPLCAIYRAPNSYTGEDVVEFFLHASPYIIAKLIERCCQLGARVAQPGEFTQRAFLNGRMDLAQAEAVADLIAATGRSAHRLAIAQREGALSRKIRLIREKLLEICSLIELQIDFSDQDLPVFDRDRLKAALDHVEDELRRLADSFQRGRLLREGAVVVIAGAPNVGKSTLFNALLGEDKAIVDPIPGTTRDAVEGLVEWEGLTIRLLDTAGQGDDFYGVDQKAVERARVSAKTADLTLWVVDLADPSACHNLPGDVSSNAILIGNKADLAKGGMAGGISVSALLRDGLEAVKSAVISKLLPADGESLSEAVLTRERHVDAVRRSLLALRSARRILDGQRGEELLAADLREAVNCLGEIIGEVTPEYILNRIFADFCIGK